MLSRADVKHSSCCTHGYTKDDTCFVRDPRGRAAVQAAEHSEAQAQLEDSERLPEAVHAARHGAGVSTRLDQLGVQRGQKGPHRCVGL